MVAVQIVGHGRDKGPGKRINKPFPMQGKVEPGQDERQVGGEYV